LIPDTLAYHFLLTAVATELKPDADARRAQAYVSHLGFHSIDDPTITTVVALAREYVSTLEALRVERDHGGTPDATKQFLIKREALIRLTAERL
jgi:hypothetical protein